MKITYIANARMPSEKAHGIQIMKMCEAFACNGIKVELVLPKRRNKKLKEINPFEYYKVKKNFKIKKLPCWDLVNKFSPFGLWLEIFSFSLVSFFYLFFKKSDLIYSRDINSIRWLSFFKKNIFYEIHSLPKRLKLYNPVFKRVRKIIAITDLLKNSLIQEGINSNKLITLPDGVDLKKFNFSFSKKKAREKLNLPIDKKIVLYTGHLYKWKGVDVLAQAADLFAQDIVFVLVGGNTYEINQFKERNKSLKNLLILGQKSYSEIPYYLKAADILVLPNSKKDKISREWTSPLKLFEYMASQRPILASDLPSLREALNQNNALFFESDQPRDLASKIDLVLEDQELSSRIAAQALIDVKEYTWQKRVKKIISIKK